MGTIADVADAHSKRRFRPQRVRQHTARPAKPRKLASRQGYIIVRDGMTKHTKLLSAGDRRPPWPLWPPNRIFHWAQGDVGGQLRWRILIHPTELVRLEG